MDRWHNRGMFSFLVIACCISFLSADGIRNHETSSNLGISTLSFGVKTRKSGSSQLNESRPLAVANSQFHSSDQQNIQSLSQFATHSPGQDDVVHGLLPISNQPLRTSSFGTRIQVSSDQSDCSVKGRCSTTQQRSSEAAQSSSHHQERIPSQQFSPQRSVNQDSSTNFEQRQDQEEVSQEDDGDASWEQPIQEAIDEFGAKFPQDDQFDNNFKSLNFGQEFADPPRVDALFPGQDEGLNVFQDANNGPFTDEQENVEVIPEVMIEERQNPTLFDYLDQQGYVEDASDFQDQDNTNTGFDNQQKLKESVRQVNQQNNAQSQGVFQQQLAVTDGQDFQALDNTNTGFDNQQQFKESVRQVNNQNKVQSQGFFQQQFAFPETPVSNENAEVFSNIDQTEQFEERDPIEVLRYNVPGSPGDDYPILYQVPDTNFDCNQQQFTAGIYGDMDAQCQVFHFCKENGGRDSFLCPNGTVFNQQYFVCDWWYNYNCTDTPSFYNLNAQLYWDFDSISPTQILTGSGISGQEAEVFDEVSNSGQFHDSFDQTQVTKVNNQQQSTFDSSQIIQTNQQKLNSFAEKRQDVSRQPVSTSQNAVTTNQNSFVQQSFGSNQNQNTKTVFSNTGDTNTVRQMSRGSSGNVFVPEKNVAQKFDVNQQSVPFSQSVSSDSNIDSRPDSNTGPQFPDQSGFVQQQDYDDGQFSLDQGITNEGVLSNQDFTNDFENSDMTQDRIEELVRDVIDDQFDPAIQSILQQPDVYQEDIDFPIEVVDVGPEENENVPNDPDVVEQKDYDSNLEESFLRTNPLEMSDVSQMPVVTNEEQKITEDLEDSPQLSEDPQQQSHQEIFIAENVDDNFSNNQPLGSNPNQITQKVFEENVQNNQKEVKDLKNINQEHVNYANIVQEFGSRNTAFFSSNSNVQSFQTSSVSGKNTFVPANPESSPNASLSLEHGRNVNNNAFLQSNLGNVQQHHIPVENIFSMMRGFSNNGPQEQRQSFTSNLPSPPPDNQNIAFKVQDQDANVLRNNAVQNTDNPLSNAQQRNKENQWWQNAQQQKEITSDEFPNQERNEQVQSRFAENEDKSSTQNQRNSGSSNRNFKIPTNGHQSQVPTNGQSLNENRINFPPQTNQEQNFRNSVQQHQNRNIQQQLRNTDQGDFNNVNNNRPQNGAGIKSKSLQNTMQFQGRNFGGKNVEVAGVQQDVSQNPQITRFQGSNVAENNQNGFRQLNFGNVNTEIRQQNVKTIGEISQNQLRSSTSPNSNKPNTHQNILENVQQQHNMTPFVGTNSQIQSNIPQNQQNHNQNMADVSFRGNAVNHNNPSLGQGKFVPVQQFNQRPQSNEGNTQNQQFHEQARQNQPLQNSNFRQQQNVPQIQNTRDQNQNAFSLNSRNAFRQGNQFNQNDQQVHNQEAFVLDNVRHSQGISQQNGFRPVRQQFKPQIQNQGMRNVDIITTRGIFSAGPQVQNGVQANFMQEQQQPVRDQGRFVQGQLQQSRDQSKFVQNQVQQTGVQGRFEQNEHQPFEGQGRFVQIQQQQVRDQNKFVGNQQQALNGQGRFTQDQQQQTVAQSGFEQNQQKRIVDQERFAQNEQQQTGAQGTVVQDQQQPLEDQDRFVQDQQKQTGAQGRFVQDQQQQIGGQGRFVGEQQQQQVEDQSRFVRGQQQQVGDQRRVVKDQQQIGDQGRFEQQQHIGNEALFNSMPNQGNNRVIFRDNYRQGRSSFTQIQPQIVSASDGINLNRNAPGSTSYNGWKPILRH